MYQWPPGYEEWTDCYDPKARISGDPLRKLSAVRALSL
jgi:hypothetical protein